MEHAGGAVLTEFYRGSEAECRRIAAHSMSPQKYNDKVITSFRPIVGPLDAWEEFLREWSDP